MRLNDKRPAFGAPRSVIGAIACAVALACGGVACSKSPVSPSTSTDSQLLGVWTGRITSDAIGAGSVTIVFTSQIGPASAPLLTGTWSFGFDDARFSTTGLVSANFDRSGTLLGLFFDRNTVPCPGQPDGVSQRTIAATMTIDAGRMRGEYIAGGCPGGALELTRLPTS